MKTRWSEFIELSMPQKGYREFLKTWVKNASNGVKNEKALMIYGYGQSGKTTLGDIIEAVIGKQICTHVSLSDLNNQSIRYDIKDYAALIIDELTARENTGILKCMIDDDSMIVKKRYSRVGNECNESWPNIIIITNDRDMVGIERRSAIIRMHSVEKFIDNKNILDELLSEIDSIRGWFLD